MCTHSKIIENEIKKKDTTMRNKKKIILLLKPHDRVKSVFVSTTPGIRIGQLQCKIADSTKISKHSQKQRRVASLPLFNLNHIKHNFFDNNRNEYTNYDKSYVINKKANQKLYKRSRLNYPRKPVFHTNYKIFRCELNTTEETCCCSCNSDAMFEVMKSLYDCYKKKNCNNCNCILCGYLPREERRLGEKRKSEISVVKPSQKEKVKKTSTKATVSSIKGKTMNEKELFLKEQALQGKPLPSGKTKSEEDLLEDVRKAIGLPSEPKSISAKKKYKEAVSAGIIIPLEGKSPSEKEKILHDLADLGLPLPEGRTSSEKSMIAKVKADAPPLSEIPIPSEKLKQAKAAGLFTPIKGKSQEQKENILKGLALHGIPLPEAKTNSEKKIMDKIIKDVGLPPVPEAPLEREQYNKALVNGIITPLDGKTSSQKEKILRNQAALGLKLPDGRTSSEKALIAKIKASSPKVSKISKKIMKLDKKSAKVMKESKGPSDECICELLSPLTAKIAAKSKGTVRVSSEKIRKAKEAGYLTPLEGKPKQQKEKILRGLAMQGLPLPEGRTPSDIDLVDDVRKSLGLPPAPRTSLANQKYNEAIAAGIITPLEGKTLKQKEKVLREQAALGLSLPEGRTSSEKSLVAKIKSVASPPSDIPVLSKKLKKAKADGLLTPLDGKTYEQKEKILKGLAMHGIPLPEAKSTSEKKIIDKIRKDVGLPPVSETKSGKEKYKSAIVSGVITPLEGKTTSQKEKVLRQQAAMGLSLPEGRTKTEKALIEKIKATTPILSEVRVPSQLLKTAITARSLTSLEGKTKEQKEKILKGLAMNGVPLPEGKSPSENRIIEKIRADIGLPPEPESPVEKNKYRKAIASGLIAPLEGKSPSEKENILRKQVKMGLTLPEGRTSSEKVLIQKMKETTLLPSKLVLPSKKLKKAKAAGLLTPLEGKSKEQKEKILKGLALHGIPFPEAKTTSEKKIMDKTIKDVGLPPVPEAPLERKQYNKALVDGIITPLEGKTSSQKEKILRNQAVLGLKLPDGRTSSEKALIEKIKASSPKVSKASKKIMKLDKKSAKVMKEGKGPSDKCICGLFSPLTAKVESKEAVRVSSEKIIKAKDAGYLTPLEGKPKQQKEKILRGLAMQGLPLPEGKSPSDIDLVDDVRKSLGLPPAPRTSLAKQKYNEAIAAGIITPLEGKTLKQKEKVLREQAALGLPLPEGRTSSEKSLVAKVKAVAPPLSDIPVTSKQLKKAKAAGLLTPIEGKTRDQKEKILKGLAMHGIPIPQGRTSSEKKILDKVHADLGLPTPPGTLSAKEKYQKAYISGLITPLEGKSSSQKEKILQNLAQMGIALPAGRTPSEKSLIAKIKETPSAPSKVVIPPEKILKAKVAGLMTPLEGKPSEQKEKILKGLAMHGIPLPEAKTSSEKKIINKIIKDIGLPPEPETPGEKNKYRKAIATGLIIPLEGKSPTEKEKLLRKQATLGLKLPEGRTKSEKALIETIKATSRKMSEVRIPSQVLKKAKAAGLLTPLEGKTKEQKEKILKGLAMNGIPLPEAKNSSERKIMNKIRTEVGLPPEPVTAFEKDQYVIAIKNGLITPLEGKTASQKEKVLRNQAALGLKLPEGRTFSEKALIAKIKTSIPKVPKSLKKVHTLDKKTAKLMKKGREGPSDECICDLLTSTAAKDQNILLRPFRIPSEKIKKAKKGGYLTPLEGKSKEQKEKILKGLAMHGIPLPEPKSKSEKHIMDKIRADVGLPPLPKASIEKEEYNKALVRGLITPLDGKTASQKEKILRKQAELGLMLPEGRTKSEKSIIKKLKSEYKFPSVSEKDIIKKAKADGLLVPLKGKTAAQKEKIIKGLAEAGLPLPASTTASEKSLIQKVKASDAAPKKKVKSQLKAGITESFKDVIKTTTCDKGCGCDKKKIKFKHSYVKIRVTSPDISSLCPCPDECVPGVNGGVFLDNEGIKVTVGRATAITIFSSKEITQKGEASSLLSFNTNISTFDNNDINHIKNVCPIFPKNISDTRLQGSINNTRTMFDTVKSITSEIIVNSTNYRNTSSRSSIDSCFFNESESSLGFITPSETMSDISLSMSDTSYDFNRNHQDSIPDKSICKAEVIHNKNSCNPMRAMSEIYMTNNISSLSTVHRQYSNMLLKKLNHDIYALETTQAEIQEEQWDLKNFIIKGSLDENVNEISKLVNRIITTELSARSSSFIILIPTSSDDISESSRSSISSSICMQASKIYSYRYPIKSELSSEPCVMCSSTYERENNRTRIVSTDTTQDRPCCCNDLHNIEAQNSYRRKKISFSSTPPNYNRGLCSSSIIPYPERALPKSPVLKGPGKCKITKMEVVRQTISVACGPDENSNINQRPKTLTIKSESPCSACVKFNVGENEISSKPRNLCPCQENSLQNKTSKTSSTAKKSKNNICECPEEPSEELEHVVGNEYLKLIQSNLTQTTSGFKLDIPPKEKSEMSFEDVLKYYYQEMEKDVENDKKKSRTLKKNECECPELIDEMKHNERFKGIKIHIEGKGSGSRGLNGILCFELFEYARSHQ